MIYNTHIQSTTSDDDRLVTNNITNNYNNKSIYPIRIGRHIYTTDVNGFVTLQSHTQIDNYLYTTCISNVSSDAGVLKIRKINMDTGLQERYTTIAQGGHGNGITTDGNYIYVVNGQSGDDTVRKLNQNLDVVGTYHTGYVNYTKAIAYDKNKKCFYVGRVTGDSTRSDVLEFDTDFNYVTNHVISDYVNLGAGTQDMHCFNNVLYMLTTKPTCVIGYDTTTWDVVERCNVESYEGNIREVEGISDDGKYLTLSSTGQACSGSKQYIAQYYRLCFDTPVYSANDGRYYSPGQKNPIKLNVKNYASGETIFNPNGEVGKEFAEIWEAIDYACTPNANARVWCYSGVYSFFGLHSGRNVYIEGEIGAGNVYSTIQGFHCSTGAQLYLKNMSMTQHNSTNAWSSYSCLMEQGGKAKLQGCLLYNTDNKYCVYVNTGSELYLIDTPTINVASKGVLVGDSGLLVRDKTGFADGEYYVKNNGSAIILPTPFKAGMLDTTVTTSLNLSLRGDVNKWQYIELLLTSSHGGYITCKMPASAESTNAEVYTDTGYCKFHFENNTLTCTHNDISNLTLKSYILC